MKKVSFQANITSELNSELNSLKTALNLTNSELLTALLSFYQKPFKSELSTAQRVEKEIQNQLSGTGKINTYTIRKAFGINTGTKAVNANIVNDCLELYKSEIEAHNAKFEA